MRVRRTAVKFWRFGVAAPIALFACAGGGGEDVGAPNVDKITVFYPVDGLAPGRGLPGAIPSPATHVRITAHPSGGTTIRPLETDGAFSFKVAAISDDILEITPALDAKATKIGASAFVRVPVTPRPQREFVCCQPTGTCQDKANSELGRPCPDPATGVATSCGDDSDCALLAEERLVLNPSQIQIGSPGALGTIRIEGSVTPDSLVLVQNRAQTGVGGSGLAQRVSQISDENGAFVIDGFKAKGDDELVIEIRDLNGFRSPQASFLVPDAELAGVDVVGAYAFEPLTNGQVGTVAIRVSPFGVDGRGICPNDETRTDPVLCFGGGLTFEMLSLRDLTVDTIPVDGTPTTPSQALSKTRATEGDVLQGAQNFVVVLDMSQAAGARDPNAFRIDAAKDIVRGLRPRDSVALVSYRSGVGIGACMGGAVEVALTSGDNARSVVIARLDELENAAPSGEATLFSGVCEAANLLRASQGPGQVVIVTASDAVGGSGGFEDAFDRVKKNRLTGFPGYKATIADVGVRDDAVKGLLRDLSAFTSGYYVESSLQVQELAASMSDLRSLLVGSFVLLYDVFIPDSVGKQGTISLTAEVSLGGKTASGTYSGPLRVLNSSND